MHWSLIRVLHRVFSSRNTFERIVVWLAVFSLCFSGGAALAQKVADIPAQKSTVQNSTAPAVKTSDPGGVIQFLGAIDDAQLEKLTIPDDSMLIRVNRRLLKENGGLSPREYYYILTKRIDPTEKKLLSDAMDGQWNAFGQLEAALIAEGIRDAAQQAKYLSRMETIVREVRQNLLTKKVDDSANLSLTKQIFTYLHQNVLTGQYHIDCSDVSAVMDKGDYNCVSATLLFNILAERMGMQAMGLEKPGHVLSRVYFDEQTLDLETTCANWFSLPNSEARLAATREKMAHAVKNDGGVRKENNFHATPDTEVFNDATREVSSVQLVAMIYYNQGVDYIGAHQYDLAAAANAKALLLDPSSDTAWSNLMATINNWAIDFATTHKRFDLAARLLDEGRTLDATYENFAANQLHIYYHWIQSLANEGRIDDAKIVYAHATQRLPNNSELTRLMESLK